MKWITLVVLTTCVVLIILYKCSKMDGNQRREKVAFVTLTVMGWLLAALLLFFPEMPGPTQMTFKIFEPFSKLLEK